MKRPRYTDRWHSGRRYVPAMNTDLRKTFKRIRREQREARQAQTDPAARSPERAA